jgi:hypothetical protein
VIISAYFSSVYKYYNFDKIVKKEDKDSGHRPASPDALIFKGKIINCCLKKLTLLVITSLNPYFFKPKEYEFATGLRSRFGLRTYF